MRKIIVIAVLLLSAAIQVSAYAGRQDCDSVSSPFTAEQLDPEPGKIYRAQGCATAPNVQIASQMAQLNAMTALAEKVSPAVVEKLEAEDGEMLVKEKVNALLKNAVTVKREVVRGKKGFTVWIRVEVSIEQ